MRGQEANIKGRYLSSALQHLFLEVGRKSFVGSGSPQVGSEWILVCRLSIKRSGMDEAQRSESPN